MRALLIAVVVGAFAPAAAHADILIFTCGVGYANLCQSAPDGSSRSELTSDATGKGSDLYTSPSLAASGAKLAFLRGGQLYVADAGTQKTTGPAGGPGAFLVARVRPDGRKVAVGEFGNGAVNAICTYASDLTGRSCIGSGGSFGWAPANAVYTTTTTAATGYRESVCTLLDPPPGLTGCASFIPGDAGADLYDPVASPDGRLIAVTRASAGSVRGSIALYDATSGALVRVLTAGPADGGPAWSPDGRSIVFDRSGADVMTVSTNASAPGSEKLVDANGREPTWGGGTVASAGAGGCTMPRLVGKHLTTARTALKKAGCSTATVKGSRSSRAKVRRQSPAAGKHVSAGRRPVLTTSR